MKTTTAHLPMGRIDFGMTSTGEVSWSWLSLASNTLADSLAPTTVRQKDPSCRLQLQANCEISND